MKPHRLRMTHQLILSYGLYRKMEVYRPKISTSQQLQQFHSEDYIEFLKKISPDNTKLYIPQMQKFNLGICVNEWCYMAKLCLFFSLQKYICMYVCMFVCMNACMNTYKLTYIHAYVCMYVCMHACMYVCKFVCLYMYVCMHVCM